MSGAPSVRLSRADARRLLADYHLAPSDVAGVFRRHGAVQLDPLDPMATSHDLMLHARVAGYRRGDWRRYAYEQRRAIDAWDQQASLVDADGWHWRRAYHRWNEAAWRRRVLDPYPEAVEAVLRELGERGPSAAGDLVLDARVESWRGSWYGPRLAKNVLRALWHTGRVATHHRRGFHHVYDLVERVVPRRLLERPPPADDEAIDALLVARAQAAGLVRPGGPASQWGVPLSAKSRRERLAALAARGALLAVEIEGSTWFAHPHAEVVLDGLRRRGAERVRFLSPLDPLVWDREALARLFEFDYLWEVYKPKRQRRWGYYVLPVIDGHRMVARLDGRVVDGVWHLSGWWWEADVRASARRLARIEAGFRRTARFLGAREVRPGQGVPAELAAVAAAATRAAR